MDTTAYDETIFAMRDVVFRDYPFAIVRERLLQLSVGEQNIAFIDSICSELGAACLQPMSKIVHRATMIIAELATKGGAEITLRMCQKDFQDYLMYTLRRLTTKLGNLITMHPEVWAEIEARVLNLYGYWHERLGDQDGKYFHALQRYRILKQTVPFPSYNPFLVDIKKQVQFPVVLSTSMLNDVNELIEWCNTKISEGNTVQIMNTACVRNIKSRSQQLHKIWTTQALAGEAKEKVKDYYSQLRKLSKFIDAQNQRKRKQEEKEYLDSKKEKIQSGANISPTKIISPQKAKPHVLESNDLFAPEIHHTPTKVAYTPLVQTSLIDVSDAPVIRHLTPVEMERQLMEVFSSQDQIGSSKKLLTPQKQEQFDEFNMFTAAIPSQEDIPAVILLNEEPDSPLKPRETKLQSPQKEDLIDLI